MCLRSFVSVDGLLEVRAVDTSVGNLHQVMQIELI